MKIPRREIVRLTAKVFNVELVDLESKRQSRRFCEPRFAAWYLIRELRPDTSLPELGRVLGGRDHTTVMNGLRRAGILLVSDPEYAERVERVREMVCQWRPGEALTVVLTPALPPAPIRAEFPPAAVSAPPTPPARDAPHSAYEIWVRESCLDSEARFLAIAMKEHPHLVRVPVKEAAE